MKSSRQRQKMEGAFTMSAIITLVLLCTAVATPVRRDLSKISPASVDSMISGVPHLHHVGAPMRPRLVGGVVANPHAFPYQAAVFTNQLSNFCGASVISSEWILTAAYCLTDSTGTVQVVLGARDMQIVEPSQVIFNSSELYIHPSWDLTTLQNDIGLIRLPQSIEFNDNIQPIRLPSRSQETQTFVGLKGTVAGWGLTSSASTANSQDLRYIDVSVASNSICHDYFSQVVSSHICAFGDEETATCTGDNGGPLVIREADGNRTQIGVLAFGTSSCLLNYPSVYARVTSYLDWISQVTKIPTRD